MNRFHFWWRYVRGKTPWDTGITPPEIVALADRLAGSPGRALDLGCGTGTNTIFLAAKGWRAEGVDYVGAAIRRARRKAAAAVRSGRIRPERISFHAGSVTDLGFLQGAFDLVIDVGCFHSLDPASQQGYASGLARLTAPGAVFALYAFCPREWRGRQAGLTPEGVRARFGAAFDVASEVVGQDTASGLGAAWYELHRR